MSTRYLLTSSVAGSLASEVSEGAEVKVARVWWEGGGEEELVERVEDEVGKREEEEDVLDSEDELLSSLGVVAPAEVTPGVVSATALAAEPAAGSALGSVVGSAPVVASDRVGGSATLSAAERRTLATSAATGTSEAWLLRVAPAKRRASALVLHISCTGGLGC